MILSDTSIRRPVLAIVINLIIFMAGVVGLEGLAVRQLPKFDLPTVTIKTIYPGAAPELIERLITTPIEQAVASIDGIDVMSSTSAENFSKIQVKFKISKDANVAAEQVRASVSSVLGDLPDDAKAPKITRQTADAQPVIYLAFKSEKYSPLEVTDMISRRVKPILATVDGVATAQIFGERRYALRIWLDEGKMNGYGITINDIVQALRTQNVDLPSGSIGNSARTITVLTDTALKTPEAFKGITLSSGKNYVIRLEDVARVEVGADSVDTSVRVSGNDAVSVGIIRQSSANPLDLATSLKGKMEAIKGVLPQGVSVDIVFDSTISLVASIEEVKETLVEAIIIVIAVVYLFLGSWRALLVTLMTIPISLVGTFGFLYMLDYSINTFTLLAIVLAIGLVVDDAIVMLENINRYIEEGMDPIKAAFKGSREIAFAILVMTMTLAAVYAPIGLASGLLGVLFREFAFTLTIAVIISGLVAITLSPMMCSRLLKTDGGKPRLLEAFDRRIDHLTKRYSQLLSWGLTKKKYMVGVILLVSLAGFSLAGHLQSAFIPTEDQGYLLVNFEGPSDAPLEYTEKYAAELDGFLSTVPEAAGTFVLSGYPTREKGIAILILKPWDDRIRTAMEVGDDLRGQIDRFNGITTTVLEPNPLGGSSKKPVEFVLKTTGSFEELFALGTQLESDSKRIEGMSDVTFGLNMNTLSEEIIIDRDKAAELGVSVETLAESVTAMLRGETVSKLSWEGERYNVIARVEPDMRTGQVDVDSIYVRLGDDTLSPISGLVKWKDKFSPLTLEHFNQLRSAKISANVDSGHSLKDVLAALSKQFETSKSDAFSSDYDGPSRTLMDNSSSMGSVFLSAFLVIYLVLAAQFESFRDPLIILLVVPFSLAGGVTGLFVGNGNLDAYSVIGFITLIGLISKHGILITEFANQLRDQGRGIVEAVVEAASVRLRPILMTTFAMVFGALPLVIASGAGAVSRHDIGDAIVGGMIFGTLLSLFIVPVSYVLLSKKDRKPLVEIPSGS